MKDRKIFCLNNISKAGLDRFRKGYLLTDSIEDADGVLVRSADMKGLQFPKSLRAIVRAGAGVNNIPLERCAEQGIVVFNTPGANANSVKELVLAGLLLASRDIIRGNEWVRNNADDTNIVKDAEKVKKAFIGHEIKGQTLGVIGLGAIGVEVANAAIALGMIVYGYDPYMSLKSAQNLSPYVNHVDDINNIYEACDFITIHIPVTESTRGIINEEAISKMKEGMRILNFSRDMLVDEKALKRALISGKVLKYVSDFPNPLSASMENAIVLPHLGASTKEAEDNCAIMAVRQMQDYLDSGNIVNSVNYPTVNAGVCEKEARVVILYKNIFNVLSHIMKFFETNGVNIHGLTSKTEGKYACLVLDLSYSLSQETLEELKEIEGVIRVRRIIR